MEGMKMKQFMKAVYDHFNANVKGVTLYNTQALKEAEFPYGVMTFIPGVPADTSTYRVETGILQFNVYSNKDLITEILEIRESIQKAFDHARKEVIPMADHILESCQRDIGIISKEETIWYVMIQYTYRIRMGD